MNAVTRIREAACSTPAQAKLRTLVKELAAAGHKKESIYHFFEAALLETRAAHRGEESAQEDTLLEIMDLLTGFCDADLVLLPEEV
jgi:hypothetical protein